MLLTFKFRLYPNNDQRQALDRILEIHRQVYNAALQERREAWQRCGVSIRYADQANQLKEIRSFDPGRFTATSPTMVLTKSGESST